jgi:hypothetical protein
MDADALPPLADVLLSLAMIDEGDAVMSGLASAGGTVVERIAISFPLELDITAVDGHVAAVGASAPTQYTETTIMPVFHQLALSLEIHDEHPA